MDNFWAMTLLGQERPSFWRLLAPVIVIGTIALFRWLNEQAKQKERQQRSEEDAQGQGEEKSRVGPAGPRQVRPPQRERAPLPPQAQRQRRAGAGQGIHRYQPQVPSAAGRSAESPQGQAQEPQLIIEAEDLSVAAAQRQLLREREQQERLRAEAIRRARAQQAQRSRDAQRQAKPARPKSLELKPRRGLSPVAAFPDTEVYQPSTALLARGQTISPTQIRRAIVWAEILGAPRALRPYSDPSGLS